MNQLFVDGGVIIKNPSTVGGTWAWRLVTDDIVVREGSGVITPQQAEMATISNNLTEMLALVRGLQALQSTWRGDICSDSQITLGRAFNGWKWTNIPAWLHREFHRERTRLVTWNRLRPLLHQGHPTRDELAWGKGYKGYPVSKHNVACDKACGERALEFLRLLDPA